MNKHDELIKRWVAYRDSMDGIPRMIGHVDDLADELADLLEQYGRALERLGNMTRFIEEPQRYMHEWYKEDYLKEIQMRTQYARDTIEE